MISKAVAEKKLEGAIDYYLYTDMDGLEELLKANDSLDEARSEAKVSPKDIQNVMEGEDEYAVAQDVIERGVDRMHKSYRVGLRA